MTNARADRQAIQVAMSAFLFWMAIRLAMPDNVIADLPTMIAMRFQSEHAWTVECAVGGVIGVFGAMTKRQSCEIIATGLVMSAHLTLSFLLSEGGAPLLPGALVIFVCLCGWVLYRAGWGDK